MMGLLMHVAMLACIAMDTYLHMDIRSQDRQKASNTSYMYICMQASESCGTDQNALFQMSGPPLHVVQSFQKILK